MVQIQWVDVYHYFYKFQYSFAIYRVLINAIELKGAEWILWIHDLAEMDPYFVYQF